MKTLWIVTMEINAYDQEGEYFVIAFDHEPTFDELVDHFTDNDAEHILKGGGRRGVEWQWFHLREVEQGKRIEE